LGAAITIAAGLDGVRRKLDRDDLAKETLGEAFHATLTDYKRREWNDYSLTVTDWERRRYLHQW
jgi:glutamine synthetase